MASSGGTGTRVLAFALTVLRSGSAKPIAKNSNGRMAKPVCIGVLRTGHEPGLSPFYGRVPRDTISYGGRGDPPTRGVTR